MTRRMLEQSEDGFQYAFTPEWRADCGGVLQFIDRDGHIAAGYVPKLNVLNLFRVPRKHSVSYVTPAAVQAR